MGEMRGLFLDPSSTETGWAFAAWYDSDPRNYRIAAAGKLSGGHSKDPYTRIEKQEAELQRLLDNGICDHVVVETSSGKVNRKRHKGGGAGLAIYGAAVGSLWRLARAWRRITGNPRKSAVWLADPLPVYRFTEVEWIGGRSKETRQRIAARAWPGYNPDDDKDFNMSDAIALAVWYCTVHLPQKHLARA